MCHRRVFSLPTVSVKNRHKLNIFLQNGLTKIYKEGLKVKKNYQGYLESESCGQILNSLFPNGPQKSLQFTGRVSKIAIN